MFKRKKYDEVNFVDSAMENRTSERKRKALLYIIKIYLVKYIGCYVVFSFFNGLLSLLLTFAWWLGVTMFYDHRDIFPFSPTIRVWFGVPGSGKTSMAALLTKHSNELGYRVLSNVNIKGAYQLNVEDLGTVDMSFDGCGAHVILDEGSLEFDNRDFKSFASSNKPKYFALHRHMNNRVDVFSQGYDIDKRIRDRTSAAGLFHLRRFPIRGYVMYRKIDKVLFIKKEDKQMIDGFKFTGLPRIVRSKSVWDSFDTVDLSLCPKQQKVWKEW